MSNEVKYLFVGDVNAQGSILFDSISAVDVPTPPAGKFALFNDRSNGNRLSSKDSGGIVTVVGSGGGGGSFNLPVMFIIPSVIEGDPALHFAIEFHETDDYSETAVYSIDTAVSQTGIKVFDGSAWVAFPADGAGTIFYGNQIKIEYNEAMGGVPKNVRYKLYLKSDGSASEPWRYTIYPSNLIGTYVPGI